MTKISANSMRCASVNGCAHTAVVFINRNDDLRVEEPHDTPATAKPRSTVGTTPDPQIKNA